MQSNSHDAGRRRFLTGLAGVTGALAFGKAYAAPRPVVVMTSYQGEVMDRFEAAFERAHPEYRLNILWRMPHDALPWLEKPEQGGVDVYWAASPRNFERLKKEGAWRKLGVDSAGLTDKIGKNRLADADGYFRATEMAGYGFAVNTSRLAKLGLPVPADWNDLTAPKLAGLIALPIPSRVGFAPVMVDIVLQAYGWEKGWALWSEIAGLSVLVDRGSTFVTDEIASGRAAVGLSIDFFVASAIANGSPIRFVYPGHGGINPGQIAITAGAPNPDGAQAFAAFVLSEAGQRLLADPDIRKLPVRPAVYAGLPADYPRPFVAAERGAYDYDESVGLNRLTLLGQVFDAMLIRRHGELVGLWQRLHTAEAAGKDMSAVRRELCTPPLTELEAADPALMRLYRDKVEGATTAPGDVEARWNALCDSHIARAMQGLAEAVA
ncbi:MAG: extracellular solute-binding protein [Parasulfuritortus sp.]|nr:extracellular solute-binding protein [Parasulfuritortus sp.]